MKGKRLHDDKIELIHVTKKFGQELVLKGSEPDFRAGKGVWDCWK